MRPRIRVLSRLVSFWNTRFHRTRLERELDDELRAAVETLAERYTARGMEPAAARRAALADIGGIEQVKEEVRDGRSGAWLDTLLLDLRYACRGFAKAPGLTATIVITLALGIGANTAIFSVIHAMLLSPLPYHEADRLVFIWSDMTSVGYPRAPLSGPELKDLRDRGSRTLSGVAAIWSNTSALTGDGDPEQLRIGYVTTDFFSVLGAEPALGRTFRPEDGGTHDPNAIVLSWELFQRRYGGDESVIGRTVIGNDHPYTIVGVMPRHFRLLLPPDSAVPDRLQAWIPFWDVEHDPRGQQFLRVIGRMRPGATLIDTRNEVAGIARHISRAYTEYGAVGRVFNTVALKADDVREIRGPLLALFGGVAILLMIACVNVASLLIARAASRARETSLRLALGASRARLLRQSLAEGAILTLLGAAAGLIVGYAGLRALLALRPESLARLGSARIDVTVFAFTLGVSVLWGLLFSLAPLTELWKADAGRSLQPNARTLAAPIRYRMRAALVIVQIALSVVLLVSAGLLVRAFMAIQRVDPGFRSDRQLTFRLALPDERYHERDAFNAFGRELRQRLLAIPGVTGAGAISHIPYDDLPNWGSFYRLPTMPSRAEALHADTRAITTGLFEMLGVRLIEGRFFTDDDDKPGHGVTIVDGRLAQRMWPGRSALGQVILADPRSTGIARVPLTIVGVVPHLRLRSLVEDSRDQIFYPERLVLRNPMAFIVRTVDGRDPASIAGDVRAAVAAIDPQLPIYDVRPMEVYVEAARSARRFTMLLAACFAATALVLTCVGVYGVLAYAVARRRHEFGVRRALGADASQVMGEVLRESLQFAAAGCAAGLGAALLVSRLLESQLYAIHPRDPITYLVALALILAGAALACWIPVRRAMAVSPMDALLFE
jgi:putative ABC transport system permease protein